jgi:hypothetical protein
MLTCFAHWRSAIEVILSGMLMSQFQASQEDVTMDS